MSVNVSYSFDGFKKYLDAAPAAATTAMRIALNFAAKKAQSKSIPTEIQKQVAFPAGYLDTPGRIEIDNLASDDNLMTVISARERPTSLARFVTTSLAIWKPTGKKGDRHNVGLLVQPGKPHTLRRAFFLRLKKGPDEVSADSFNVGLAIRLEHGEVLSHRTLGNTGLEMKDNPGVFILYGPSVKQAFVGALDAGALDDVTDTLESEFYRQFALRVDGTV
jgi:hypothetical protein